MEPSHDFYLPPEYAPQEAVWLSWPTNPALWPGRQRVIPAFFAQLAATISRYETVRINAVRHLHAEITRLMHCARAIEKNVELFDIPTNDVWCRDHGPLFLKNKKTGEVAVSDWHFNAWGAKFFPYDLDDAVPARIAQALGLRCFSHKEVLEGGAIEVNDAGQLLTSESVLLNPNRHLPKTKKAIEKILKAGLGVEEILWLGDGLEGDDTDGHIDNLARFATDDIIIAATTDKHNPSHAALTANKKRLKSFRTRGGKPFEIVELPLPEGPVTAPTDGRELPASYVNYLLINNAILMPAYAQPSDERAYNILKSVFHEREVIPIDCTDILIEGGALHCLTQQQPR